MSFLVIDLGVSYKHVHHSAYIELGLMHLCNLNRPFVCFAAVPRCPVSAPPGFSVLSRPPPGFSSNGREHQIFDGVSGSLYFLKMFEFL